MGIPLLFVLHSGNAWNMDAAFALRWSSGNLARSAYDGRYDAVTTGTPAEKQAIARSPAVDAGSRDFLNAGWTRTDANYVANYDSDTPNPKADNPAPKALYDPENVDWGSEPNTHGNLLSWADVLVDFDLRLDMGYHYGGAQQFKHWIQYPTEYALVHRALRHPKERVTLFDYDSVNANVEIGNVTPKVYSERIATVVSGRYTASGQEDLTCAVYAAEGTTSGTGVTLAWRNSTFAAHWFRQETAVAATARTVKEYTYTGDAYQFGAGNHVGPRAVTSVASDAGPDDGAGNVPIYAAAVTEFNDGQEEDLTFSDLDVFRYNESNDSWYHIATLGVERPTPEDDRVSLTHVALAAQNYDDPNNPTGDLWVFWILANDTNQTGALYGRRLVDARALDNSPDALSGNLILSFNTDAYGFYDLKADWDEALSSGVQYIDGVPRVVFVDDRNQDGTPELVGARVALYQSGEPSGLDQDTSVADLSGGTNPDDEDTPRPAFAVNSFDDVRFPTLSPDDRGFIRFQRFASTVTELWTSDLSVDGNGDDVYDSASQVLANAKEWAVAPRAFGLPRVAFIDDSIGGTSTCGDFVFDAQAGTNGGYPHLEAQRVRKDNLYLLDAIRAEPAAGERLDIFQLHP